METVRLQTKRLTRYGNSCLALDRMHDPKKTTENASQPFYAVGVTNHARGKQIAVGIAQGCTYEEFPGDDAPIGITEQAFQPRNN